MNLEGFSVLPLAQELNAALVFARIDKITQPCKNIIYLSLRKPGENLLLSISAAPQNPSVYITNNSLENPKEPPMFCMVLRKQLESGRISAVRERKGERIIEIDVDTLGQGGKIAVKTIIVELMGKNSNIILTEENIVIDALRKVGSGRSKSRVILQGHEYAPPEPQNKLNLREEAVQTIIDRLKTEVDDKLLSALINTIQGFGPLHAKETAYLAGLSPDISINELDAADFESIASALAEVKSANRPTIIINDNNKPLGLAAIPIHYELKAKTLAFETMSQLLDKAAELTYSYTPPDKERFQKLVKNELSRAKNKLCKLNKELSDAENAEIYKIKADNLMTYQYEFKDHADSKIRVKNIYSPSGETVEITLDKRITLLANMQNYYKKYDKLKRAKIFLTEQIQKNADEIAYLESVENSLAFCSTLAEIDDVQRELVEGNYLKERVTKKTKEKIAAPFSFVAQDGTVILVGKNNAQNDTLTTKTAAPHDLWLHTKDIPGSHVIIRTNGEKVKEETLLLAGNLAVHFSKAKGSTNVPVDTVECRYIKKPSGSKPGFVIFTHQKTIAINADEELLKQYLALP
ncbi:MAG: NFACT family protein [Selenomonadaceae bacterium]|nr:NFACT family protein [Selenomonadaceae bacterium]